MINLLVSFILFRQGESQLFYVTRSTCKKYQLHFVELCVHLHLLHASLSLLRKHLANRFFCDIAILFQLQMLSTFHILNVVATLSILAVYLTRHHYIIDRIHRLLSWLGPSVQLCIRWLGEIPLKFLGEIPSDMEGESDQSLQPHKVSAKSTRLLPLWTITYSINGLLGSHSLRVVDKIGNHVHDRSDEEPPGRFRQLKKVSSTLVRKSIRSFQGRWSTVRHALNFQRNPFQDASLLVQAFELVLGSYNIRNFQTGFQLIGIVNWSSSSMISAIIDAMDETLRIAQVPRQWFDSTREPALYSNGAYLQLPIQLPGIIQCTSVKALPDTGSGQNVIDSVFMRTLSPTVMVEPLSSAHDMPLVAPDGVTIPCTGKVSLPWAFRDEAKTYHLWFYVVENCSYDVIIGNGFLRETETFEEHQERLEINTRSDLELQPGCLVSKAQDYSCRRQIVSGIVNGQSINASLDNGREAQGFSCRRQIVSGIVNGQSMIATLDTGCEAHLMSADYAKERGLKPIPLPGGNPEIKYANGRKGSTLGQVEVDWSFDDDSLDVVVKIKCYVLPVCIHSVIFGVQFALSEKPWEKHRSTLSWKELIDTGDAGVVGLVEKAGSRRFWLIGKRRTG